MKKSLRKFKRSSKVARIIYVLITIVYLVSFILFAKSIISLTGIETLIRYVVLLLFFIYLIFYVYINFIKLCKKKYGTLTFTSILSAIFIFIFVICFSFIDLLYSKIASFNEDDNIVYVSYLITMNDEKLNAKSTIGMISDNNDIEGYVLANDIIKDYKLSQEIKYYDSYIEMLYDLYDQKITGAFVSGNYVTLYSNEEDFKDIATDTKIVYKLSKKMENTDASIVSNKSLTEPFTVLIMGVDSEYNGLNANAAFNGDTLILATFNPKTLNATLFSIPRDTYVPIACRKNTSFKINSSAAYGTSCVIDTIENLTGVKIDYYVKINFKGVVDLVDALGGVEVDVEKPDFNINHGHDCQNVVCEQNSDRKWGDNTIYINLGKQTLNGEQALAYARNRGQYLESDLARNRHQQDVILAIAKKAVKINSYSKFRNTLDSISKNISTNMSTTQMLSSYDIFKDMLGKMLNNEEFIGIQKTYLETYSLPIYLASANLTLSALGYYEDSLNDIIKAMNINLELEQPEIIKTFSYSIEDEYTTKVAGKGLRSGSTASSLKNFISKSKEEAQSYCDSNDLECIFTYIDENSQYYDENIEIDKIAYQNPHAGSVLSDNETIHFYINGSVNSVD